MKHGDPVTYFCCNCGKIVEVNAIFIKSTAGRVAIQIPGFKRLRYVLPASIGPGTQSAEDKSA